MGRTHYQSISFEELIKKAGYILIATPTKVGNQRYEIDVEGCKPYEVDVENFHVRLLCLFIMFDCLRWP